MAEDNKKPSLGVGNNSAIVVALIATGAFFFVQRAPLNVSRPPAPETQMHEKFGGQDIEARLWQDPFAVVANELRSEEENATRREAQLSIVIQNSRRPDENGPPNQKRSKSPDVSTTNGNHASDNQTHVQRVNANPGHDETHHARSPLFAEDGNFREGADNALVLAVSVSGAPYFEDAELRGRLRYAVLSALLSEKFEPEDEAHLGFFKPKPSDGKLPPLPRHIPLEWFQKKGQGSGELKKVLVLWIDEDVFGRANEAGVTVSPTEQFALLRDLLCQSNPSGTAGSEPEQNAKAEQKGKQCAPTLMVLGPSSSRVLQLIAKDPPNDGARFFSYGATISDDKLTYELANQPVVRTIAQDNVLARVIVAELQRRRVTMTDIKTSVALISDRDTLYGRKIRDAFERELRRGADLCNDFNIHSNCKKNDSTLINLNYFRGLDGMTPREGAGKSSAKSNLGKDESEATKAEEDSKRLERPFGQGQFDYLRRLADQLKAKDDELRREGGAVKAIGVLGNDVFDKLLLLRALKPLFPEAVFFTTDYDAVLSMPKEREWTRNLVVASSYGPTLADDLQADVIPFRSAYQTSAFIAARLALEEKWSKPNKDANPKKPLKDRVLEDLKENCENVRLFEIDRNGQFVDLRTEKNLGHARKQDCGSAKAELTVQPRVAALYQQFGTCTVSLVSIFYGGQCRTQIALLVLLLATSILGVCVWRYDLSFLGFRHVWRAVISAVVIATLIALFWDKAADFATENGWGEPIAWLNGASLWPAIGLRIFAIMLAVGLVADAWRSLERNLKRIHEDLAIGDSSDIDNVATGRSHSQAAKFKKAFSAWRLYTKSSDDSDYIEIEQVWKRYVAASSTCASGRRIVVFVALFMAAYLILCSVFGFPQAPWRGDLGWVYSVTVLLLLASTLVLVFLVFDSTLLCLRFVELLGHSDTRWPDATRAAFVDRLKVHDRLIDDWIDLVFIAKRTRCIGKLIYFPFAMLALIIVSRSTLFDAFPPSTPILVTEIVSTTIVFGCAMMLSYSANHARNRAKSNIEDGIIRAKATEGSGVKAAQLGDLLKLVANLNEGAFVPLSQQAPIRALLLPLSGIGWTALMDYRLLPGAW